jgi:CCR4-NOT transcription complex subunit 1
LLDDLRVNRSTEAVAATKADLQDLVAREQLGFWFAEWVRVYSQSPAVEKSFVDFVTQLQKQGILKGEEISSLFFRVCTEVGVESYIKQMAAGDVGSASIFQPVDAFAKLVVFMIKYHSDAVSTQGSLRVTCLR